MAEQKEHEKGKMTVEEAGHRGGERTAGTHGREFYQQIGHKGGQKVRELIGKAGEKREGKGHRPE
jgi:general stress protein YciG